MTGAAETIKKTILLHPIIFHRAVVGEERKGVSQKENVELVKERGDIKEKQGERLDENENKKYNLNI